MRETVFHGRWAAGNGPGAGERLYYLTVPNAVTAQTTTAGLSRP